MTGVMTPAYLGVMTPDAPVMTPSSLTSVPNKPKTPLHSFRVDDELWDAAKKRAEERGETLADALRAFLKRYTS